MRTGIGYDIHRLVAGRPLILGGVKIPHPKGLKGHSDGDVLLHALVDAVLGAAGAGDIGVYFPPTDPRWKGADSRVFVEGARKAVRARKLKIGFLDAVIVAERPKLSEHRLKIRDRTAEIFGLAPEQVNIKAKTREGLGEIGRGQAIACFAVATLTR